MTALLKSRKSKAATLVPLALLSAAWTASLASASSTASAAHSDGSDLPDGSAVPSQAIKAPASVPIPGAIAPAVPDGTADAVVSGASASGIPAAALSAYQRGAQIIDAADTTCNVPWELIAAIGRVESNHGQFGGNTLGADGVSKPGVFGPQLNGQNGTQAIMDTDGGQLDQDPVYDRAVGPMQFIPSTWSSVKVDADGDGQRNPQDIDDAALASGVYLCSGTDDLSARAGQEAAVFRYNHSRQYVDLVLRIMEAYSAGDYTAIPSGTYGGTVFSPSYASTIASQHQKAVARPKKGAPQSTGSGSTGSTGGSTPGTGTETGSGGTPSVPVKPTDPVGKALQGVGETVGGVVQGVTQPVAEVLGTLTEALGFCNQQFASIPDPLGLLGPAKAKCAAKVQGMTEQDAAAVIPNTLQTILSWLGLAPAPK
ncbi:lytic transglycosylase domain-containing protein [Marmoricola sp. RAF53]|uniref:lytic transglycosylase domain-containing protein n=1 Tax=Marmoricola sp. RAF53 TaxID=3233059 RepID=UPI003F968AC0